ncbi:M42 family metallopeptidase [Brachyspira aalborgi]|uniref:M42 family metallopeptidase n=1 Tax=Brachyspira aalborgi TaxID=29522 RepID=UPI002667120F|nr:M42 family metallopeptidase [Brachyspira aalborgi]
MHENRDILIKRVLELSDIIGPSYREDRVIEYLVKEFKKITSNVEVDNIGNINVIFKSESNPYKFITLFAHSDEIGFIIKKIENNGFIRIERIGGVNRNILHGTTIQFINENGDIVLGVIGVKSHHFMKDSEKGIISSQEELYVDIGAFSKEEVCNKYNLRVGSVAVFYSKARVNNELIIGKAMDDRANCALLLCLAEEIKDIDIDFSVCITISVQEEFNIRGILPAIERIKPYIAIGLDITPSCDTPDLDGFSDVALNKGVGITAMNFHGRGTLAGMIPDEKLLNHIIKVAKDNKISHQYEVALGVLTETAFLEFSGNYGVPCASLSIPTRYTHTNIETISINDLINAKKLLYLFLNDIKKNCKYGKSI